MTFEKLIEDLETLEEISVSGTKASTTAKQLLQKDVTTHNASVIKEFLKQFQRNR